MTMMLPVVRTAGVAAAALLLGWSPARAGGAVASAPIVVAQDDNAQPTEGVEDPGDSSGMVVRIGRLEAQIRTLTGQIEQLQFANKRLEDNLRKMQGDVDFRFQDLERQGTSGARPAQKRGDADAPQPDAAAAAPAPAEGATAASTPRQKVSRAGDAFDPDADPNAPGAPKALGTTMPSQPIGGRPARASVANNAPLDLMQRPGSAPADSTEDAPAVVPAPAAAPRDPNAVASLVPGGTRDEYDADLSLYKQGQFDTAANGFQSFASKYPRDRLVPDAVFLAGESYARLGRHREAAEQFLKVSTDYGKSSRAPDALLRLGMSLNALGAKDQACATYLEVNRRYPTASADVRSGVDRELRRAHCPGNG